MQTYHRSPEVKQTASPTWQFNTVTLGVGTAANGKPQQPVRLSEWANFLGGISAAVEQLEKLALPERWSFVAVQSGSRPHPILHNYVRWTFFRLCKEGKVHEEAHWAAFNTGLVDRRYEPIYALFNRNRNVGRQPWFFQGFCFAGEGVHGKELVRTFNPLPAAANYFRESACLFYDVQASAPSIDWEHIIIENISRLPEAFLKENVPPGFAFQDATKLLPYQRLPYFAGLAKAVLATPRAYRCMKNRMEDALNLALKRVRWNYKTAIPQYYPTLDQMSLLLPLALVSDEEPDLALVVEKTPSGNYLGHTVLPLDWAYNNARLVCRPLSDWLSPEKIAETSPQEAIEQPPDSPISN